MVLFQHCNVIFLSLLVLSYLVLCIWTLIHGLMWESLSLLWNSSFCETVFSINNGFSYSFWNALIVIIEIQLCPWCSAEGHACRPAACSPGRIKVWIGNIPKNVMDQKWDNWIFSCTYVLHLIDPFVTVGIFGNLLNKEQTNNSLLFWNTMCYLSHPYTFNSTLFLKSTSNPLHFS